MLFSSAEELVNHLSPKAERLSLTVRHGREIFATDDLVIKVERIDWSGSQPPECWNEFAAWSKFLSEPPEAPSERPGGSPALTPPRFAATLSAGSTADGEWAWCVQKRIPGINCHSEHENLPEGVRMRYYLRYMRAWCEQHGLNYKELQFRGQYVYNPTEKEVVCVDYGHLIGESYLG